MNPFKELQQLINPSSSNRARGTIVRSTSSSLTVVVNGKSKTIPTSTNLTKFFKKGDNVTLQGNVVIGKIASKQKVNVYYV